MDDPTDQLEIERTYLLCRMPDLPQTATSLRMQQGYFNDDAGDESALKGRLRRSVAADGTVHCTHTIKTGKGLIRREVERSISEREFQQHWPATQGRRLCKTRYCVPSGPFMWEIDVFDELDLVLAEVELPAADAVAELPDWLAPCIVREVTDEKQYRNHALARRLAQQKRPS